MKNKDVEKYVFNKGVLSYPIFRLMQHAFRLKTNEPCDFCHSTSVYVLDEFVDFLLENHIAGVDFKELYDFKDELIWFEDLIIPYPIKFLAFV